ncbi:MAG: type II toxin-antitoxin system VapC family toxin [Cyanobacteria bacterium P01_A01_bin.116]
MMFLFDTNIISELFRHVPNKGVILFNKSIRQAHISVISIDEILFGLSAKPSPRVSTRFEKFVKAQCIILPVSSSIAQRSGELRGQLRSKGIARHQADMMIAATAYRHKLTLVTRNVKDFELCDINIINPFD